MSVEELVQPFAYPVDDLLEHAKGLALQNQDLHNSTELRISKKNFIEGPVLMV